MFDIYPTKQLVMVGDFNLFYDKNWKQRLGILP